jgi:localization factor PodJL
MRRHLLSHLEGLDLDALEVAEAAAHRAGTTLEEWLAAALAEHAEKAERSPQPRRRAGEDVENIIGRTMKSAGGRAARAETGVPSSPAKGEHSRRDEASRTAIALESMAGWIEHAEERLSETARLSADHQDRMASVLSRALSALKERLDAVERSVATERATSARIEGPVQDAVKALSPLSETLVGLRSDMSRLAERLDQPANPSLAPAVAAVRSDIERIKAQMETLATHDDIAAMDLAIHRIGQELEQGRSTKDILTLATSTAALYRQVQTLSEDLADGLHRRIGAEIELIKDRIESIAKRGIDPSAIEFLGGEIVEMRQELARRAEPRQIERLSSEVGSLSQQIAELRDNQVGRSDFSALKTSLENVCSALGRTAAAQEASTVPEQLQNLSRRLDLLANRPEPEPANLDPIAEQLALLTERMAAITDARFEQADALASMIERLSGQVQAAAENAPSQEPLLKRFDRLEDELRQVGQQADTSTVELLLRSIGERLEQQPVGSSLVFETLEQRIVALADQLARSPAEPLREIFQEAATHLKNLQNETAAIAERAARTVLKDIQPGTPATADLDALKQGFVELKALQTRSDKKTQQTLRAVHDALDTLVSRLPGEKSTTGPISSDGRSPEAGTSDTPSADRLEAAVRRLHAAALSQMEEVSAQPVEMPSRAAPGKAPPHDQPRTVAGSSFPQEAELGNVRANFIAAARRATQTGAPDRNVVTANEWPDPPGSSDASEKGPEGEGDEAQAPLSGPSLIGRIRRSLGSRRRPLLFGFAVLILAAGTFQILHTGYPAHPVASPPVETAAHVAPKQAEPLPDAVSPGTVKTPVPQEPLNLFQPTSLTTPSRPKFLIALDAIGEFPAQVTADLRAAALAGDAAAVHEIANQAAEGKGLPHDPVLAARLYEKAAQAGFAPAQERLAMMHEKGVGLPKDAKLAATWYERAARGGNIRAMHNLATLLASGVGGKPDYQTALNWYGEAAEAGVRDSQFNLGVLYTKGIGTRPNLTKAFTWFALAAAQGDEEAARKRDEIATRLGAADLAAARALVQSWQPRASDPVANGGESWDAGRTASLEPPAGGKS